MNTFPEKPLVLRAGPTARKMLQEDGFDPANVDMVVAASGGPKWQVLSGLDRVLFPLLRNVQRSSPLDLVASSIGSWRMACLAHDDPSGAIARFEEIYLDQHYSAKPSTDEITAEAERLLDALLGKQGANEITNSWARLHVIVARCKGLLKSESPAVQMAGLGLFAAGNVISRRTLGWHVERVILAADIAASPFRTLSDLPTRHAPLDAGNAREALLASGAIPLVFKGREIPHAPGGIYRDGGLIDYHPAFDFGSEEGLVLYPHFYDEIIPGWFDKKLPWRRGGGRNFDRVLMLAPSDEFIAALPGGHVPDRKDFYTHDDATRERNWRGVLDASRRLGDDFLELVEQGGWQDRLKPFE